MCDTFVAHHWVESEARISPFDASKEALPPAPDLCTHSDDVGDNIVAVIACGECNLLFCDGHAYWHGRKYPKHGTLPCGVLPMALCCPQHPSVPATSICPQDKIVCCDSCRIVKHFHGPDFTPILIDDPIRDQFLQEGKENWITTRLKLLRRIELYQTIGKNYGYLQTVANGNIAETAEQIRATFDRIIEAVEARKNDLLSQLAVMAHEQDKQYTAVLKGAAAAMELCESLIEQGETVWAQSADVTALLYGPDLKVACEEALSMEPDCPVPIKTKLDIASWLSPEDSVWNGLLAAIQGLGEIKFEENVIAYEERVTQDATMVSWHGHEHMDHYDLMILDKDSDRFVQVKSATSNSIQIQDGNRFQWKVWTILGKSNAKNKIRCMLVFSNDMEVA